MNKRQYQIIFKLISLTIGLIVSVKYPLEISPIANTVAQIFVTTIKWASLPLILFSILATATKLNNKTELFNLGGNVLKYTITTTIIAATIALILFLNIYPQINTALVKTTTLPDTSAHNIYGILLITTILSSVLFSLFILSRNIITRQRFNNLIEKIYTKIMLAITVFLKLTPIAIWAFITLFIYEINATIFEGLSKYLACVLLANLIQAIIILPTLLKIKKIKPFEYFKSVLPALNIAFWSKSSNAALPTAIDNAIENANISVKTARFSLPLCTTINMNACAAFILITVLFISTSYGVTYSLLEYIVWIFIATIAAIGNAGVPMGCYTLACILLSIKSVPLYIMGIILPFYGLIDMLESAINVWSDLCVTKIVDKNITRTSQKTQTLPHAIV